MSFFLPQNISREVTMRFYNNSTLRIPLKRHLYLNQNGDEINEVIGFIFGFKEEIERIEYPNGSSVEDRIVTSWIVISKRLKSAKIEIPFEIICVDEIEIL